MSRTTGDTVTEVFSFLLQCGFVIACDRLRGFDGEGAGDIVGVPCSDCPRMLRARRDLRNEKPRWRVREDADEGAGDNRVGSSFAELG